MGTVLVTGYHLADPVAATLEAEGHRVVRGPRPSPPAVDLILDRERWEEVAPEVDVIVTSSQDSCPGALLARCERLRGVVSTVIGVETVDVQAVLDRGLVVANGAMPENYLGVSEATVMLMAALLLELPRKQQLMDGQEWDARLPGRMLRNRRIGLVGFGMTARGVVDRLAGWDVEVLVADPYVSAAQVHDAQLVSLDELLRTSHVVSLHVPLTEDTRHLVSTDQLRRMRNDACLINTSRGGVVDETALAEALRSGQIWSAALDVFEDEPLAPDSPLRGLDNVILTPHVVGHSHELYDAVPRVATESVRRLLQGQAPVHLWGPPDSLDRWTYRGKPLDGTTR